MLFIRTVEESKWVESGESNRGVSACKQGLCTGNLEETIQSEDPAFLGLMLFVLQQVGCRSPLPHLSHGLEILCSQPGQQGYCWALTVLMPFMLEADFTEDRKSVV